VASNPSNDFNDFSKYDERLKSEDIRQSKVSEVFTEEEEADLKQAEPRFVPSSRQSAEQVSDQDRLNRSRLVSALAAILTGENEQHQTIGLLGDWGVGKSTTVHLLKNDLQQKHAKRPYQQPYLYAEFNAWEYEHTNNLQAGIAQEMLKGLSSYQPVQDNPNHAKRPWYAPQRLIQHIKPYIWWVSVRVPMLFRFAIALNGPKLLLLLAVAAVGYFSVSLQDMEAMAKQAHNAGVGMQMFMGGGAFVLVAMLFKQAKALLATPLAKEWMTYMKLPDYGEHLGSIPVMRKNIRALCKVRLNPPFGSDWFGAKWFGGKKRLLFLVDDLDRCGQEGIVKVFEAVRLVLDIPQVTVIIAVDQRIALAALSLHYQDLAQHHQLSNPQAIARDYLAKVIHMPITLTPADPQSIKHYLDAIWQETAGEKPGKPASPEPAHDDTPLAATRQGLSDDQKRIFKKWVAHFGFTNPRQLKRLHNSYNLLRHYYGEDGQISGGESTTLDSLTSDLGSPMLITLFALEYINSLEDSGLRGRLLYLVKQGSARTFQTDGDHALAYVDPTKKLSQDVLDVLLSRLQSLDITYVQAVEPFVLPAIQQFHSETTDGQAGAAASASPE
jgi:hypothetical protein